MTVRVTYFVPAPWKVKLSFWPVPSAHDPPLGGSSAQENEHGAAAQLDVVASSVTAWPVTGEPGLNVNDAVGAFAAARALGAELEDVDPPALAAVTTERIVWPRSEAATP